MLVVRNADSTSIDAAAVFALEQNSDRSRLFTVAEQAATVASLFARDEQSADRLASGVADFVQDFNGMWELEIQQICTSNPVADALDRYLPAMRTESALPVPTVRFAPGMTLDQLLSRNMRKQLKRAKARLDAESPGWYVKFVRGTDEIMTLLPDIEETHIERDHERRRESDLDNALARRFWQETVVAHSYTGELELGTLMVGETVAAYVLALVDGDAYRVFDGRMNGEYAKCSPGRVLEAAALERALDDARFSVFDWMTGVAPETILAVNDWEARLVLRASGAARPVASLPGSTRMNLPRTELPAGAASQAASGESSELVAFPS